MRLTKLLAVGVVAALAFMLATEIGAYTQSLGELNRNLAEIETRMGAAVANPDAASGVIDELDRAETEFAQIAENQRSNREDLMAAYGQLDGMLDRMYRTYQKRKDDCIEAMGNGQECNYDQPEQLALRALYPLSWLRFEGALLHSSDPATARRLLNESIDGFTNSSLVILQPELVRENLLGRAFAERELGKYDHRAYQRAIADFKKIMSYGVDTRQYRPAEQGLATTYAAMGKMNEAQGLTSHLAENAQTPAQRNGLEMLHLRELFKTEDAESDPAKRAAEHRQIIEYARAHEDDKDAWAIVIASAADYVRDPIAEFGASGDPFQDWLLANVLYYKHQNLEAAKYYWQAAKSGKYPKAYKYAADLYYSQGRLDMVRKLADEIAAQPGSPDAPWAAYMAYKIPRIEWERGGMRNAALEADWVKGAEDYLRRYPDGQYAFEARFRLAERLQQRKDYVGAAKLYGQVKGNADYEFTARFNAADCYYQALGGKALENGTVRPSNNPHEAELRAAAIKVLREAIALEPQAERDAASAQRRNLHESRGRAIFLLATMLESDPHPDYKTLAAILDGFESQYPTMKDHFKQIFEWRLVALDHLNDYAALDREVADLVNRNTVPGDVDYFKEIGLDFWKSAAVKQAAGDQTGYQADARLTAATYEYFRRLAEEGKIPAKNLTGTLSILGQAYLATNQPDRAQAVFEQVAKADPGSPDANAGLALIAQQRKDYKDSLDLWSRVEAMAAQSDPLFYESQYHVAEILAEEGNTAGACNKLTVTRGEHPNLGSPEMKSRWDGLQRRLCAKHTEG